MGDVSSRVRPTHVFPAQPVVEFRMGRWSVEYSRESGSDVGGGDSGSGSSPDEKGARESGAVPASASNIDGSDRAGETTTTTAAVSISTVRVIDLLQRVPCHGVFRELLVIPAKPAPGPVVAPAPTTSPRLSPPLPPPSAKRPASPSWQEWLEEGEASNGERVSGRRRGNIECGAEKPPSTVQLAPLSTPASTPPGDIPGAAQGATDNSSSGHPPSVLVTYRNVVSFFGSRVSVSSPAATATAREKSRATAVSVDLDGPISANWNPRTLVALWGVRAALACSATGTSGANTAVAPAGAGCGSGGWSEEGAPAPSHAHEFAGGGRSIGATAPPPVCSSEFRVSAPRGVEVRGVRRCGMLPSSRRCDGAWGGCFACPAAPTFVGSRGGVSRYNVELTLEYYVARSIF